VVEALAAHKARHPEFGIASVHFFPLGGIKTNATWLTEHGGKSAQPASEG
jgi:methylenetetrahydrofolate reductase (NADPH)